MKFRKKPVVIEAWQFIRDEHDDYEEMNNHGVYATLDSSTGYMINTLEGKLRDDELENLNEESKYELALMFWKEHIQECLKHMEELDKALEEVKNV